ncbi:MAG: hypothetical protein HDR48_03255 [Bacteroides sp.]|nr:hypothetical protein [Bacteroides sp.]MBD5419039.1 hypothetical protein [Bacteroides sp.]
MNPALLKLVDGKNFVTKGKNMVGYVAPENLAKVADMLSREPFNLTVLEESKLTDADTEEKERRYRFAENVNDFDELMERAVEERGIVMPGLNERKVSVLEVGRHDFSGTGKEALRKAEHGLRKTLWESMMVLTALGKLLNIQFPMRLCRSTSQALQPNKAPI